MGPRGASLNRWRVKGLGIGRAGEVREGEGGRNKVRFSLYSCSSRESAVFPGADPLGPETLPGTAWHPARRTRAGWAPASHSSHSLLPRAPSLTQGRVLPCLPFTEVHCSGYSGGDSSRSRSCDCCRFLRTCGRAGGNSVGAPVRSRRAWDSCQPLSEPEGRGTSQPLRNPLLCRISTRSWEYWWGRHVQDQLEG